MKKNLILSVIILLYSLGCSLNTLHQKKNTTIAIPANSDLIIKFHDINKISNKIQEFQWWEKLKQTNILEADLNKINILNDIYNLNHFFYNQPIYLSCFFHQQTALLLYYRPSVNW